MKTRKNVLELYAKLKRYRIHLQPGALRSSEYKRIIGVGTKPHAQRGTKERTGS